MNKIVKCKDCKFWDNNYVSTLLSDLIGTYGVCDSDAFNYDLIIDNRTDMLIYLDHEGYSANFDTGADFGCIHGKNK